jgi:hypothetical protein
MDILAQIMQLLAVPIQLVALVALVALVELVAVVPHIAMGMVAEAVGQVFQVVSQVLVEQALFPQ